ncbi:Testis-specific zinc finger protein topi, partial [Stegodyphus mimosarum]
MLNWLIFSGVARGLECLTCQTSFTSRSILSKHMRQIHNGHVSYQCEECSYSSYKLDYLKRHIIIHTGERPYLCGLCKKGFGNKSNYNRHIRCHARRTHVFL